MEQNIMANEEVVEATEEIVTTNSGKAFKVVAGIGLAALVGTIVYKGVVKPFIAKIKAKKAEKEEGDFEKGVELGRKIAEEDEDIE
jgi:flagellar biosynthesis/type III secretory pathway M-ring protein FliF/YscJ